MNSLDLVEPLFFDLIQPTRDVVELSINDNSIKLRILWNRSFFSEQSKFFRPLFVNFSEILNRSWKILLVLKYFICSTFSSYDICFQIYYFFFRWMIFHILEQLTILVFPLHQLTSQHRVNGNTLFTCQMQGFKINTIVQKI